MVRGGSSANLGAPETHERAVGKRPIKPTLKAFEQSLTPREQNASAAKKPRAAAGPSGGTDDEADDGGHDADGEGAAGEEIGSAEDEDEEEDQAAAEGAPEGAPEAAPLSEAERDAKLAGARFKHTTVPESRVIIKLVSQLLEWRKSRLFGVAGKITELVANIVGKAVRTVKKVMKEWTAESILYDGNFWSAGGRKKGWRKLKPLESPELNAFIRERIEASNRPKGPKEQASGITFRKLHHLVCSKFGLLSARPAVPSPLYLPIQTFIDHVHQLGARRCKGGRFNPLKFAPATQLRVEFFLRRYHKLVIEPAEKYARNPLSEPKPPIQIFFDEAAFSENSNNDFSLFFGKDKLLKRKHGKGKRLMIEHCLVYVPGCYNADGKPTCFLLDGAELSITDDGIVSDEHYKNQGIKSGGTLTAPLFEAWAEKMAQLVRTKFPNAQVVAVFDNASVHSVNAAKCWAYDKCPSGARKGQLQDWLKDEIDLPFNDLAAQAASLAKPADRYDWNTWHWWTKASRAELMEYAVVVRGGPIYRLDESFKKHNITTCRTPPYYPEWQPIEHVWGYVKTYVYVTSDYAGIFPTLQAHIDTAYAQLAKEDGRVLLNYREHCHKLILAAYAALPPRAPDTVPPPPAGPSIMESDDELASDPDVSDDEL